MLAACGQASMGGGMFGSFILDVAVGMVFIYLLLSLVASGVNEILASIVQSRAANLERGLRSLFSGDSISAGALSLVDNIYNHGLIRGLYPDPVKDLGDDSPLGWVSRLRLWMQKRVGIAPGQAISGIKNPLLLPSYIPARAFALAMIDILNKDKFNGKTAIQNIEDFLSSHHQQFAKNKAVEALLTLAIDAKYDAKKEEEKLQRFQANLENWYNDAMDRVSGWYKRYTQRVLLIVGLVLAVAFNVNSINIAHLLWVDRDVRTGLANAAADYWKSHQPLATTTNGQGTNESGGDQGNGSQASASTTAQASGQAPSSPATDSASADQTGTAQQTGGTAPTSAQPVAPDSTGLEAEKKLAGQLRSSVQAFTDVSNEYLLPVGWRHSRCDYVKWWTGDPSGMSLNALVTLAGWLITAGALSLGASFWFDMLNKIMVVRNTVKPQEKSAPEGSKD
jgi:hypothetical protein